MKLESLGCHAALSLWSYV